ncbi:MAG: hypothetical protein MMC23_009672 [Stictis urceolatum]|nr:hypothetical protein [Stictis urceolata]
MPLAKNQMWSKNGCRLLRERTGLLKALRMRLVEDYETSVEAALVERPKPMFVGHTDGSRKRASSGPIDPIQLMIVLREDLIEERPKLLFDYLSYHKAATCLSILLRTTLTDTINQQMPLFYSNFTRKELLSLPFVISSLVQIMGHKPNGKHTSTGLRTLNIVGDIFERFVAGNGIAAVKGRAKLYEEPVSNSEEGCVRPDDSGSNGGGAGEDGKEQEEARVGRPQS